MARMYLVGGQALTTEAADMGELHTGDVFVSNLPNAGLSVYRVTSGCSEDANGYLSTVELRDPPADVYFACPPNTPVDKVVGVREVW